MRYFRFLHSYMVLHFCIIQYTMAVEKCDRTNCKNGNVGFSSVLFGSFKTILDKKIAIWTSVTEITVSGTKDEKKRACIGNCTELGVAGCRSGHLMDIDSNDDSTCALFSKDPYAVYTAERSRMYGNAVGSLTFHLVNSFCERTGCNSRPCRPDFKTDTGYCECEGQSGRYCQIPDPLNHGNAGHWIINDNNELVNIAPGANALGHGQLSDAIIIEVPDRKGKVIQCNGKGTTHHDCFSAPYPATLAKCLSEFVNVPYCPVGFTYGFWLRILRDENYDFETGELSVINQASMDDAGIIVGYRNGFFINVETTDGQIRQCLLNSYEEKALQQWNFIAFSYNPYNKAFLCAFNTETITGTTTGGHVRNSPANPFRFGGPGQFLIADIFYVPGTSKAENFQILYEKTKK